MRAYRFSILMLVLWPVVTLADCGSLAPPRGVPTAPAGQWSLVTLNVWRLVDHRQDAKYDDPVSLPVLRQRLDALADYIHHDLSAPHVLALQEVEKRSLLEQLSRRLAKRGLHYRSLLLEGHDPSGINVAVLYRSPVKVERHRQLFAEVREGRGPLFSRPPLAVTLSEPWPLTLVVVHLRSARDLHHRRVFRKCRRQAAVLADWAAGRPGPLLLAGDFNSAPGQGRFSDPVSRLAQSPLINLWQRVPPPQRYSYRYRCRPQALDHVWSSSALAERVQAVRVSRGNAGRYRALYGSQGVAVVSDHDALAVYLPLRY